jgi:hypothetical protein
MNDEIKNIIDTIIKNIINDQKITETYMKLRKIGVNAGNVAIISHSLTLLNSDTDAEQENEKFGRESEKILQMLGADNYDLGKTIELLLIIIGALIDNDDTIRESADYIESKLAEIEANQDLGL